MSIINCPTLIAVLGTLIFLITPIFPEYESILRLFTGGCFGFIIARGVK